MKHGIERTSKLMKKEKAIEILNLRKEILLNITPSVKDDWLAVTQDYIGNFLGSHTKVYTAFGEITFLISHRISPELQQKRRKDAINSAIRIIDDAINYIENNGLYKADKPNWICRLSDRWVTFILSIILLTATSSFYVLGTRHASEATLKANYELQLQIKDLKNSDSLK